MESHERKELGELNEMETNDAQSMVMVMFLTVLRM